MDAESAGDDSAAEPEGALVQLGDEATEPVESGAVSANITRSLDHDAVSANVESVDIDAALAGEGSVDQEIAALAEDVATIGEEPREEPVSTASTALALVRQVPLAVVVGTDRHSERLAHMISHYLSGLCQVVTYPSLAEAAEDLGDGPGFAPEDLEVPVALLTVVVGPAGPTADALLRPIINQPGFRQSRLMLLCTTDEVSGVEWLTDSGRLDWVGLADNLQVEPTIEAVESQLWRYHEHQKADSAHQVASLFEKPYSDAVIIGKILEEIEMTLGPQPRIRLPEGVSLTTKGEWVEEVTLILRGSVALLHDGPAGEIVMHEESTGRIIGLLAVSEGRRAQLNAITTSEVVVVRLTVEQLNSSIHGHPDIALMVATLFIRSLDRRLRRAEQLHVGTAALSKQLAAERAQLATALANLEGARTELAAQERLASLGALSSGLAHELNNPMAAIQRISEFLGEDVTALLKSSPDQKWAALATRALESGLEAPSLSSRQERKMRRELAELTGDPAVAHKLALAGIHDPKLVKKLNRRSGITLEGAVQAASIGTQLRNLASAAVRITDLVSSLRSFSRPDGDTVVGVDIHENLDDSIRLLSHKLKHITVERSYKKIPLVECHPGQLAQVWTNVLTNAAEAIVDAAEKRDTTEPGGGMIPRQGPDIGSIKVRTSVPAKGWIRIEFIDDGPGISEKILPRIFEPRFTTKSGQVRFGMGVGLGVSRSIVGRHHGTMRIRTKPTGTTVVVDLPVTQPKEST